MPDHICTSWPQDQADEQEPDDWPQGRFSPSETHLILFSLHGKHIQLLAFAACRHARARVLHALGFRKRRKEPEFAAAPVAGKAGQVSAGYAASTMQACFCKLQNLCKTASKKAATCVGSEQRLTEEEGHTLGRTRKARGNERERERQEEEEEEASTHRRRKMWKKPLYSTRLPNACHVQSSGSKALHSIITSD